MTPQLWRQFVLSQEFLLKALEAEDAGTVIATENLLEMIEAFKKRSDGTGTTG